MAFPLTMILLAVILVPVVLLAERHGRRRDGRWSTGAFFGLASRLRLAIYCFAATDVLLFYHSLRPPSSRCTSSLQDGAVHDGEG